MSPYKALFGRDPPLMVLYVHQVNNPPTLQEMLQTRDALLRQLKTNLSRAQNYMKTQADKKSRDIQLAICDMVLVKLQPYRQQSLALRKNYKLGLRYFGPFEKC